MNYTEKTVKKCRRLDRINKFLGMCLLIATANLVLLGYGINVIAFVYDNVICKFI